MLATPGPKIPVKFKKSRMSASAPCFKKLRVLIFFEFANTLRAEVNYGMMHRSAVVSQLGLEWVNGGNNLNHTRRTCAKLIWGIAGE